MSEIGRELDAAIELRPVIPSMPWEGVYPSSYDEVAEEIANYIREFDAAHNRGGGLIQMVRDRLAGEAP